jgi:hypothetical protein
VSFLRLGIEGRNWKTADQRQWPLLSEAIKDDQRE